MSSSKDTFQDDQEFVCYKDQLMRVFHLMLTLRPCSYYVQLFFSREASTAIRNLAANGKITSSDLAESMSKKHFGLR
jgi:hypothetical protein